jgi:predicted amino acid racemase
LEPLEPGIEVLGASSDHLVLDVENADPYPSVGDVISFKLRYPALARASASETITVEIDRQ